jgi:hypothetical protein
MIAPGFGLAIPLMMPPKTVCIASVKCINAMAGSSVCSDDSTLSSLVNSRGR